MRHCTDNMSDTQLVTSPALLPFLSAGHLDHILHVVDSPQRVVGIEFNSVSIAVLDAQDVVPEQHLWKGRHVHLIR